MAPVAADDLVWLPALQSGRHWEIWSVKTCSTGLRKHGKIAAAYGPPRAQMTVCLPAVAEMRFIDEG